MPTAWCACADLIYAFYPIRLVGRLQLPTRHKVGVCFLLAGGVFTAIAAIVRVYYSKALFDEVDPACETCVREDGSP